MRLSQGLIEDDDALIGHLNHTNVLLIGAADLKVKAGFGKILLKCI